MEGDKSIDFDIEFIDEFSGITQLDDMQPIHQIEYQDSCRDNLTLP